MLHDTINMQATPKQLLHFFCFNGRLAPSHASKAIKPAAFLTRAHQHIHELTEVRRSIINARIFFHTLKKLAQRADACKPYQSAFGLLSNHSQEHALVSYEAPLQGSGKHIKVGPINVACCLVHFVSPEKLHLLTPSIAELGT